MSTPVGIIDDKQPTKEMTMKNAKQPAYPVTDDTTHYADYHGLTKRECVAAQLAAVRLARCGEENFGGEIRIVICHTDELLKALDETT